MSRFLVLLIFALGSRAAAQEPAHPATEDRARAAFDRMAASLWRPRDQGLEELRFSFEVEVIHPDRPIERHGPFRIHWRSDGGWKLLDAEGRVDTAPEKRMSVGFADRAVNDLVGWDSSQMIAGRELRMPEEGLIEIEIPRPAVPDEVQVERILLELNAGGSLRRQSLVGTGGVLLARLDYFYVERAGRRLVSKLRRDTGGTRVLKTETYQDVGRFTFPAEIRSLSADRRLEVLRYRDLEVLKPAPAKK